MAGTLPLIWTALFLIAFLIAWSCRDDSSPVRLYLILGIVANILWIVQMNADGERYFWTLAPSGYSGDDD